MLSIYNILGAVLSLSPFPMKLLIGEMCFAVFFKRRERFVLRLIISAIIQVAISIFLFLLVRGKGWLAENTLYYFLQFAVSVAFMKLLFDEKLSELLPCAVSGYMMEHISAQIFEIFFGYLKIGLENGDSSQFLTFIGVQIIVFLASSGILWLAFAKNAKDISGSSELKRSLLFLSVITLCVVLLLSSVRDRYAGESQALMVITRLLSIFSCLTLLYIRYVILEKSHIEAERAELERIVSLERKQFEQSRENIELINIKCHDMRHKIEAWEKRGLDVDKDEIAEMKNLIGIYDSRIKTGNDTLDIILTERSLYCEKEGIRLSCIADGEKLGFMTTGDICSLFGNAVENAIEAVSKLDNPEDRIISFQVREKSGMLVITVDNYYSGTLRVENGLPKSTKGDDDNHGFGMKSIRLVAEKYGGEVSITVDDMFHLTVIIPLPTKI